MAVDSFMTVVAEDGDVKQLRNPDNVSTSAIQDGLYLYRKLMACEDPILKQPVQLAMQVRRSVSAAAALATRSANKGWMHTMCAQASPWWLPASCFRYSFCQLLLMMLNAREQARGACLYRKSLCYFFSYAIVGCGWRTAWYCCGLTSQRVESPVTRARPAGSQPILAYRTLGFC